MSAGKESKKKLEGIKHLCKMFQEAQKAEAGEVPFWLREAWLCS